MGGKRGRGVWGKHCRVVKYFENHLSGLYARLTLGRKKGKKKGRGGERRGRGLRERGNCVLVRVFGVG